MSNLSSKYIFIIIITAFSFNAKTQKMKKGLIYNPQSEKVFLAKEIIYYGIDFSHFKVSDFKKINQGEEMKTKHIPALAGRFNEYLQPERASKHLEKQVIGDYHSVQFLIKDINPDNIVLGSKFILTNDSISEIIKNYKLKETTGIGLVQIPESFNKAERYVTSFSVFFDIQSREVLYSIKAKGLPGSKWGFTDYLYNGLIETYSVFIGYYKKEMKTFK